MAHRAEVGERVLDGTAARKRDPAALWRAIAGMAIALALACAIVMLEFAGRAMRHADRMHRRAAALSARVTRLEGEIAAERAQLSAAHRRVAAEQSLLQLLHAPDATVVALAPLSPPPLMPSSGASSSTASSSTPSSAPSRIADAARGGDARFADGAPRTAALRLPAATLVIAPREGRAVLIVAGLAPPGGEASFALWWSAARIGARGLPPTLAASFRTAADGSAVVAAALSPDAAAAIVTLERNDAHGARVGAKSGMRADGAHAPSGPILLRAAFRR